MTIRASFLNARFFVLLQNARDKINKADINNVINDFQPFLESREDAALITRENLESLLKTTG